MKKMSKQNRISALLIAIIMIIALLAVDIPNGMSKVNATVPPHYPYPDPVVHIQGHVQNIGWQTITNKGFAGTTGKSLRLEAIKIGIMKGYFVDNGTNSQMDGLYEGNITVSAICGNPKKSLSIKTVQAKCGEMSRVCGTTGLSQPIIALSFKLSGEIDRFYNISYRVYVQNKGWKPWVSNGVFAYGDDYPQIEAIEVKLEGKLKAPHYPLEPDPIPDPIIPPKPIDGEDRPSSTEFIQASSQNNTFKISSK